ncbi:MAG: YebC/PmpR family DNA-binding transcriptional regulator [Candidatus Paceibacterota bacterium]|jgi:YebC/PmpR family DNA-binding regulatory protein
MSGHSKWKQIKRQKGVADVKRGKVFSQLSKMITIAARSGGDPDFNPNLRIVIEKAKKSNMPADNIEKAIKKGTGELAGATIEEVTYEGYGPGGIAIIIECTTDSNNRTVSEMKNILSKNGGRFGESGSVKWMFDRFGFIDIETPVPGMDKDELEMNIIDAGAQDFEEIGDSIVVYMRPEDVYKVKESLEKKKIAVQETGFEWRPKNKIKIADENVSKQIETLFDAIDAHDDVNEIYSNMEE